MKESQSICTRCRAIDSYVTDFKSGEIVCKNCGLVLEERIIDDTYEKRNFGKPEEDIQQFDIGIALAHFLLSLEEEKKDYSFVINDPNIQTPGEEIYICSVVL